MKKLLIIILLIGIGIGGYYYLNEPEQVEEINPAKSTIVEEDIAIPTEPIDANEKMMPTEPIVMEKEGDIFSDKPPMLLKDVTGGSASGEAWVVIEDGTTYHKVVAINMPKLENEDFYEGWLVKSPAALGFFSTGEMIYSEDEGIWILEYETEGDKSDYPTIVITLEPNDGDPAPALHILEN